MELTTKYDKNAWLSLREIADSGLVLKPNGFPYAYESIKRFLTRQLNGSSLYFTRPDGSNPIIKVESGGRYGFTYLVHESAVRNFQPPENYSERAMALATQLEPSPELIAAFESGQALEDIAESFELSTRAVMKLYERYIRDEIARRLDDGESPDDLASEYGLPLSKIYSVIDQEEILARLEDGENPNLLADEYELSPRQVYRYKEWQESRHESGSD